MRLTADKVVTWTEPSAPAGVTPEKVYVGPDPFGLGGFQVAVATARRTPSRQVLRDLFTARKGKTQIQLVVAVVHDGTVHLFGPDPQAQPIVIPVEQAERQLQSVLSEPDVLLRLNASPDSARRTTRPASRLHQQRPVRDAPHHEQRPEAPDWAGAGQQAATAARRARKRSSIEALGFKPRPAPTVPSCSPIDGHPPRAVAVLLDDSEQFDAKTQRFQLSPVAFGLAVAARQEVPWLVVLRKDQIRLYPGRDGVGVGSKGQAETFFEIDLSTIDAEYAALLPLIFSANALAADGTPTSCCATALATPPNSARACASGSTTRSSRRSPSRSLSASRRTRASSSTPTGSRLAYRVTLRILFRLALPGVRRGPRTAAVGPQRGLRRQQPQDERAATARLRH